MDLMVDLLRAEDFVMDWVVEDEEDVDLIDVVFVFEVDDDDDSDLIEFIFCGEKLLMLFFCSMFQQMTLSLVLW